MSTLGSMFESIRLDRALATKPLDPPKELKNQWENFSILLLEYIAEQWFRPIEACVSLLPIYEFLRANSKFPSITLERSSKGATLLFTSLSLSSYLLTHATSTSSPRSLAYANLSLNWLLLVAENGQMLSALAEPSPISIRLCRQVSI